MPVIITLFVLEVVLAVAVVAAIILQTGYSAGISGAFGGGGGGPSTYGGKKQGVDQLLEKVSLYLAIALGIVTLLLAHYWR